MTLEQVQSAAPLIAVLFLTLAILSLLLSLRYFRKSRRDAYWRRRRIAGQRGWRLFVWSIGLVFASGVICLATGLAGLLTPRPIAAGNPTAAAVAAIATARSTSVGGDPSTAITSVPATAVLIYTSAPTNTPGIISIPSTPTSVPTTTNVPIPPTVIPSATAILITPSTVPSATVPLRPSNTLTRTMTNSPSPMPSLTFTSTLKASATATNTSTMTSTALPPSTTATISSTVIPTLTTTATHTSTMAAITANISALASIPPTLTPTNTTQVIFTSTAVPTATNTASPTQTPPFTVTLPPTKTNTATSTPQPTTTIVPTKTASATSALIQIVTAPALESSVTPSADARISISALDTQISGEFLPVKPATAFKAGFTRLYYFVDYTDMKKDVIWRQELVQDGVVIQSYARLWGLTEQSGSTYFFFGQEDGFTPGNYEIRLYLGEINTPTTTVSFQVNNP